MKYTVYKITNKISGKIYIGKHQTKDPNDDYMGSGKLLGYAKKKHGIENFEKEVLFAFETEDEMDAKEAELVTEEFCRRDDTYNICPGGRGGFGHINSNVLTTEKRKANAKKLKYNESFMKGCSLGGINSNKLHPKTGKNNPNYGKSVSEEIKEKMSFSQRGENSKFKGSFWINDGKRQKRIPKGSEIPKNWFKGRI